MADTLQIFEYDVFQQIGHADSVDQVLDIFFNAVSKFKYTGFLFAELPAPDQFLDDIALGMRWPQQYQEVYCKGRFEQDDPLFHRCRYSLFPFLWAEQASKTEISKRGQEILSVAAKFGFHKGYVVPVHGPKGYAGCIRIGGEMPDTSPETQAALWALALQAFRRLWLLSKVEAIQPLTQREQEVLELVAMGKSAREIALILSIVKRTADEHVHKASVKLGAVNRTHAVAIALKENFISLKT